MAQLQPAITVALKWYHGESFHYRQYFFGFHPTPFFQFRDPGVRPASLGASRGLWSKEVVFFEMELGSNPNVRAYNTPFPSDY